MFSKVFNGLLILAISVFIIGCGGKDPQPNNGIVTFQIENQLNGQMLDLGATQGTTALGDTFEIGSLKMMLSNFKFYKDGALVFTETDSYHLIDQSDASTHNFTIEDIPVGDYDQIEFAIGVPQEDNNSSAQKGDLATNNGLFWAGWGNYIFYRFDGVLVQGDTTMSISYHVGGNEAFRTTSHDISNTELIITEGATSTVHIKGEVAELFTGADDIDIVAKRTVATEGPYMVSLANNYANGMFVVTKVTNP